MHLPSYLTILRSVKDIHLSTSLLVGALTSETVVEYAATTRHIFPDIALHVLDVEGVTSRTACEATGAVFSEGTALQMPYSPHSMDLIQAHYLFDQLEDTGLTDGSYSSKKNRFLQEAHTTLKSGGMLLMVEPIIPRTVEASDIVLGANGWSDPNKVARLEATHRTTLKQDLRNAGFDSGLITSALGFRSRRDLEQLLLSNTWDIDPETLNTDYPALLIVSIK